MQFRDVHQGMVYISDELIPFNFICDIDGTIADCSHRLHWIKTKPKNWKAFFNSMSLDDPITRIIDTVKDLQSKGCLMVMCSGRPETYRKETEDWLDKHGIIPTKLYMRKAGDYRADDIVKAEFLDAIREDGIDPKLVFDDRDSVVKMWRDKGLTCIQVAEGDFS